MRQIERLKKALNYLNEGEELYLGEDTFLTGYFDGSDKIYGFAVQDSVMVVINSNSEYRIEDLDSGDLRYIFSTSVPNIYKKILAKEYEIDLVGK